MMNNLLILASVLNSHRVADTGERTAYLVFALKSQLWSRFVGAASTAISSQLTPLFARIFSADEDRVALIAWLLALLLPNIRISLIWNLVSTLVTTYVGTWKFELKFREWKSRKVGNHKTLVSSLKGLRFKSLALIQYRKPEYQLENYSYKYNVFKGICRLLTYA